MEKMRIPPNAHEIENILIGCLLIDSTAIFRVQNIINENSFYVERFKLIYRAIISLILENKQVDIISVTEKLRNSGTLDTVGGAYEITKLTTEIYTTANVEEYAKIIQQNYMRRNIIEFANNLEKKAFDRTLDIPDLVNYISSFNLELPEKSKTIREISENNLNEIFGKVNGTIPKSGIKSGLYFDEVLNGFYKKNLIVVGGRPAHGKTAFLITLLKKFMFDKIKVGIFSLEMSAEQLELRLKINITAIDNEKIKRGELIREELEQLEYATNKIKESKIYINDKYGLTISEIRLHALEMKRKYDIDILMIDYLQLIKLRGENGKILNRENEIGKISGALKGLAKELNIPVIVLSQLNREVEKSKRLPNLSDLRESGAIEQDADVIMFLHQFSKVGVFEYSDGESTEGTIDIVIAKNRNGEIRNFRNYFDGKTMTILNNKKELPF